MTASSVDNLKPIINRNGEIIAVQLDVDHMPVLVPLSRVLPIDLEEGMPGYDPGKPDYFPGQEPSARTRHLEEYQQVLDTAGAMPINDARRLMGIGPSETEKLAMRAENVARVIRLLGEIE